MIVLTGPRGATSVGGRDGKTGALVEGGGGGGGVEAGGAADRFCSIFTITSRCSGSMLLSWLLTSKPAL